MKTFLLSIPKRLMQKDRRLDVQATLCYKSWTVFKDEGVKQLLIFQPNGSLLITTNGIVANSTWNYIAVNNSIIITTENKSVMFHPAFIDDVVFALQQDGDGSCLFMIDEYNGQSFLPKSLKELEAYFYNKEQRLIDAQREYDEEMSQRELEKEKEAERLKHIREVIEKENADEIKGIYAKAKMKRHNVIIGSISVIVAILVTIIGGLTEQPFLIVISFFLIVLGIFLIISGDVNPNQEVSRYIEDKVKERLS